MILAKLKLRHDPRGSRHLHPLYARYGGGSSPQDRLFRRVGKAIVSLKTLVMDQGKSQLFWSRLGSDCGPERSCCSVVFEEECNSDS